MQEPHYEGEAESVRHGQPDTNDPPPEYPIDFSNGFVLPEHSEKPLQRMFAHDRDKHIQFYEKPHVYCIDGRAYDCSVTTLVKSHVQDFNPYACIRMMKRSKKNPWPRLEYAHNVEMISAFQCSQQDLSQRIVIIVSAVTGCTLFSGSVTSLEELEKIVYDIREQCGEAVQLHLADRAMTNEEILAKWDANKVDAANRGTWIHWQLELWSNGMPCYTKDAEFAHAMKFVATVLKPMGVRCFATEKEVFGEAEEVCGSIDWVGYYESDPDSIIIVDWKRSKNLATSLVCKYNKRMKKPLSHLDDADGCKYALQLSCYAYLMEKYYNKKVKALCLCCVHPSGPINTFVPYLKREVSYLMRKRREVVASRVCVFDIDPEIPVCGLTSHVLYDPVSRNGTLYNRKDALVHFDGNFEDANGDRFNRAISQVSYMISAEEEALGMCVPWRELMPETGLALPPPI